MIINHNLNAMNAQRNSSLNLHKSGKSMEKLSSGLRINNASDDAAGLAISEKMRGQIRGLDQATRNSQDGISLIQTAEGALNETHSIIQRMRELAVQSSNDTNTSTDRNEIQKEINQLTSEVNRIGNTTEFNTQKLLSSGVSKETKDAIVKGLKDAWLGGAEKRIDDFYGLTASGKTPLKVVIDSGSPYGELAHVGGTSAQLELHIDASDFAPGTGVDGKNIHDKLYNDRIIAHEMTHAVMNDSLGAAKMNTMPTWFKEGTAEFMAGADERVRNVIGDASKTGVDSTKLASFVKRAEDILGGASWDGSDTDYAAGYVITKYLNAKLDTGKSMKTLMPDIKGDSGNNGKDALEAAIAKNATTAGIANIGDLKTKFAAEAKDFIQKTGTFAANGMTLDWSKTDESDVGAIGGKDAGGTTDIDAAGVIDETKTLPASKFNVVWPEDSGNSSVFSFQIGANEGQNFIMEMKDMRAAALKISGQADGNVTSSDGSIHAKYTKVSNNGVTNGTDNKVCEYALDVSTSDNATAAIKIFDEAIHSVSSFRSELGSVQNRLEHTVANLNNSSENLSSAESRVRDVDMAKEMMEFSKDNVLGQAAQAMLAQAKSQPEAVLQLLR